MSADPPAPTVSVASLCFNTGRFVVEALKSLERQTFRDFDVVVVDDGSTDDSVTLLKRWAADSALRLRLLENGRNQGIPASLNRAILASKGDLVTWLSDDEWDEDRLETVVDCFSQLPESVQVLFGDAVVMDEHNNEVGYLSPATTFEVVGFPHDPAMIPEPGRLAVIPGRIAHEALQYRCFLPAPSVTVRRSLYDVIGLYDESLAVEDLDCWFRASAVADFAYLRRPLVRYRLHTSNFSGGSKETYLAALAQVLARHGSKDAGHRRVIKRHLREESFRVASAQLSAGRRAPALRALRVHYVPNLQPTLTCLKESCRLIGRLVRVPRPAEVR
jgi:glycosyltransferase involved in cell wall biosynthesis